MMENRLNRKTERKGQSAIEYLTTYGWAILAIVIVGAVIIAIMQGSCPTTQSINTQDIQIAKWGYSATDAIEVQLTNTAGKRITLQGIYLDTDDDGTYNDFNATYTDTLGMGETISKQLTSIGTSKGCNTIKYTIQYLVEGMTNPFNATGTLKGKAS